MSWRAGAILGLGAFLLVCGWWLARAALLYARVGDLQAVWSHTEMADPGTILTRALGAMIAMVLVGAYLGGRARTLTDEALEEHAAFALIGEGALKDDEPEPAGSGDEAAGDQPGPRGGSDAAS